MSRDLERRLAALERATSSGCIRHVVTDRLPWDEDEDEKEPNALMTEAEWVDKYCKTEPQ